MIQKKQTQLLIGIGAVVVIGYLLLNKNKTKTPCPKYVDCMPGPGGSGDCYIRPECVGITQTIS